MFLIPPKSGAEELMARRCRLWSLCLRVLGEKSIVKSCSLVSTCSVVCKISENLVNNTFFHRLQKTGLFWIIGIVSSLLVWLQIFWQLQIIEFLGLLTWSFLYTLVMLLFAVFLQKLKSFRISSQIFSPISSLLRNSFVCLWMRSFSRVPYD